MYNAIGDGHLSIIKLLIEKGNYTDENLSDFLLYSVMRNNLEFIIFFFNKGAKINDKSLAESFLFLSDSDITKYLLLHCSDIMVYISNNDKLRCGVLKFLMKQNLDEYTKIIDNYRTLGIDVYDMVEHEN